MARVRIAMESTLDAMVAAVVTSIGSATRSVISALVAETGGGGTGSGDGNVVMILPNADGSWTGKAPAVRQPGVQYWWLTSSNTLTPSAADGFLPADWASPPPGTYTSGGFGVGFGS